jgi:hypothetical protein
LENTNLLFTFALLSTENEAVDFVAQLVEQYTFNVWALGSSPSGITKPLFKSGFFVTNYSKINSFDKKA